VRFARATGTNLILARTQWLGMSMNAIIDSLELLTTRVLPLVQAELGNGGRAALANRLAG
jgi:hypothetical protein